MKYLFGLGNPGNDYADTRHNMGFQFAEVFRQDHQLPDWKLASKFHAEVSEGRTWRLYRPQTFMNDSGVSVRSVLGFYQKELVQDANPEFPDLYVAFDDLDLELGSFKVQFGKGPKVHNGLLSIYEHLHSEKFWHVRIGVDSRQGDRSRSGRDYVLSGFSAAEREVCDKGLQELASKLDQLQ